RPPPRAAAGAGTRLRGRRALRAGGQARGAGAGDPPLPRRASAGRGRLMDFAALDRVLREAAEDLRLDADEKQELRELGQRLDAGRIRFLRNRALAAARDATRGGPGATVDALRLLQ